LPALVVQFEIGDFFADLRSKLRDIDFLWRGRLRREGPGPNGTGVSTEASTAALEEKDDRFIFPVYPTSVYPTAVHLHWALNLAEKSGSRTHQKRLTPLAGFEVRAPHRGAFLFRVGANRTGARQLYKGAVDHSSANTSRAGRTT
jgi:hypothetical protein